MDTVVISGGGKGDRPVGSCGWHQKRGPAVCGVRMRVPRVALEARFLDAVRERQALLARSARRPAAFDREALAAKVEARVRELRSGLGGSSERGRGILRALLGSDRIRVSTEGERGFRLEGTLWLEVETGTAREHEANGRFHFAPPVEALSSTLGALRRAGFEF